MKEHNRLHISILNNCRNVSKPVAGRATNNSAEIEAATEAARQAQKAGISKLKINTDSEFLVKCNEEWMPKWKANGWKTSDNKDVINKTELQEMTKALGPLDVTWVSIVHCSSVYLIYFMLSIYLEIIFQKHVSGHAGIHGNEKADELARAGCARYRNTE